MIQCQQAVCFTTTESGLQLKNRFSVLPTKALQRLYQKSLHALCNISTGKEFNWISIFKSSFASGNLRKICRKLSVQISSLRHIRMRLYDLTPARKLRSIDSCKNTDLFLFLFCRCLRLRITLSNRGGSQTGSIPQFSENRAYFLCPLQVKVSTKPRHSIKGPLSIVFRHILRSGVRNHITNAHKLCCPCSPISCKMASEKRSPLPIQ